MEATIARKQTTLRLGADLMDRLCEEARSGKYAGTIDTSSMEAFIKSI